MKPLSTVPIRGFPTIFIHFFQSLKITHINTALLLWMHWSSVSFSCINHSQFLVTTHNIPEWLFLEKIVKVTWFFLECTVVPRINQNQNWPSTSLKKATTYVKMKLRSFRSRPTADKGNVKSQHTWCTLRMSSAYLVWISPQCGSP